MESYPLHKNDNMTDENKKRRFRMQAHDIRAAGFIEVEPGVYAKAPMGAVGPKKHGKQPGALGRQAQAKQGGKGGRPKRNIRDRAAVYTVTMTAHLNTRMDGDNLANALKPVQDALADWLGVDDADGRIRWECGQVETRGTTGVCVAISGAQTTPCKESI